MQGAIQTINAPVTKAATLATRTLSIMNSSRRSIVEIQPWSCNLAGGQGRQLQTNGASQAAAC
jgi:hypothetical protein